MKKYTQEEQEEFKDLAMRMIEENEEEFLDIVYKIQVENEKNKILKDLNTRIATEC